MCFSLCNTVLCCALLYATCRPVVEGPTGCTRPGQESGWVGGNGLLLNATPLSLNQDGWKSALHPRWVSEGSGEVGHERHQHLLLQGWPQIMATTGCVATRGSSQRKDSRGALRSPQATGDVLVCFQGLPTRGSPQVTVHARMPVLPARPQAS